MASVLQSGVTTVGPRRAQAHVYSRLLFVTACLLASVGPAMHVVGLLRSRTALRTVTAFGRLPELHVSPLEWLVLGAAAALVVAAILELLSVRMAAPLALVASLLLWLYFAPALWSVLTSDGWFTVIGTRRVRVPWQQATYQSAVTLLAMLLTWSRYGRRAGKTM